MVRPGFLQPFYKARIYNRILNFIGTNKEPGYSTNIPALY